MTVQLVVLAGLLGWQYFYVLRRLVYIWQNDGDWSHGFIIPLFSLYYLYMHRDRMPLGLPRGGAGAAVIGAAIIAGSFGLFAAGWLWHFEYFKAISLVTTLAGVLLMVCGWPMTRWAWFAVAFLVFAIPVPVSIYVQLTMPLRVIAARVSAALLQGFIPDMIAQGQGALVEYIYNGRPGTLDIEQACSGIRLMMTMMALGVAMAFVSDRLMWQRLVMILCCVPIAIFCNIVRVTTTGFLVVLGYQDLARGFWHTMLGMAMLFVAFGLYGGISYVMTHLFIEGEPAAPEGGTL